MAKEVPAFLRAEIRNNATDPTQETRNGMLGCLAQMRPYRTKRASHRPEQRGPEAATARGKNNVKATAGIFRLNGKLHYYHGRFLPIAYLGRSGLC
jgi:hypothetical protein